MHWRQYSSLIEALFFILMFLSVISSTIYVVAKSIGHMVENESKDWSSFGQLISLLLIFPSNYFTYRAALFNMNILKEIKRNKKYMKEKGFSKCMYHSNIVFGCNKWQKKTYSEYLIARKRSKSHFYMRDMYFKIFVIGLLICIHIYRINQNEFKDALLPMWYFFLLIPFEL